VVDQRKELYISLEKEIELIHRLGAELIASGYNASNSYIVTVSADYSSIVGQILRHQLSYEGEICDGFGVDVPYPDEQWDDKYQQELIDTFRLHIKNTIGKTPILVEAGVIRGGNYTHVVNTMRKYFSQDGTIITLALFENESSAWKSDFVGEYYNNDTEDLTFWWERDNNHWS
jgi:hypothetical protein